MGKKVDMPDSIIKALKNAGTGVLVLIFIFIVSGAILTTQQDIGFGEAIVYALAFATHSGEDFISGGFAVKSVFVTLAFAVSVLTFYIFYILIDVSISGKMKDHLHGVSMLKKIKNMKDHYIICGAGRVGSHVGEELAKHGQKIVFIEKESDVINSLRRKGHLVFETGPISEGILRETGIEHARALTASLGDDSKNLLLCLTARHINPKIIIAARLKDKDLIPKFKHAGANLIIIPETVGGIKLGEALLGKVDHAHVIQI